MSAIRGKNTKPELVVRRLVHRMGHRYRLHGKALPGKPDLVFAGRRKVVFVHGCFWHVHDCQYGNVVPATNAEFWRSKRLGNVERDRKNISALQAAGWRILVVWECQTKAPDVLKKRLSRFL